MREDRQSERKEEKKEKQTGRLTKILVYLWVRMNRADDKMASEYKLEGGATLHLVLALRGGVV